MKRSSDGLYTLFPDSANDAQTGETVALWNPSTKQPHPNYPDTAAFIQQYGAEIPEPEATPEPGSEPNWVAFRTQIAVHPAYLRLVTGHPQNTVLNGVLIPLLFGLGENPSLLIEVAQIWNAMEANVSLTIIESAQLNAVANTFHIPLHLDAQGKMEV